MAAAQKIVGEVTIHDTITIHIDRDGTALVALFYNVGGEPVGARCRFDNDDDIEKLGHYIRNVFGAIDVTFYTSTGDEAEHDSQMAEFDTLTAHVIKDAETPLEVQWTMKYTHLKTSVVMALMGLIAAIFWTRGTYDLPKCQDNQINLGMLSLWVFYIGGLIGALSSPCKDEAYTTICACFVLSTIVKAIVVSFAKPAFMCGVGDDNVDDDVGDDDAAAWSGVGDAIWCLINGSLFFGCAAPCVGAPQGSCCSAAPRFWLCVSVVIQLVACANCSMVHSFELELTLAAAVFLVALPFFCYGLWIACKALKRCITYSYRALKRDGLKRCVKSSYRALKRRIYVNGLNAPLVPQNSQSFAVASA